MFENFTDRARKALRKSKRIARRTGYGEVESEHLFMALLELGSGIAIDILQELGIDPEDLLEELNKRMEHGSGTAGKMQPDFSQRLKRILSLAEKNARELGHNYVGTEHLLIGLADEGEGLVVEIFNEYGVSADDVKKLLMEILGEEYGLEYGFVVPSQQKAKKRGKKKSRGSKSKTPTLDTFCRDLTELARKEELDPVIGRKKEIERVTQILARRKKNNPVLIGEPGTGKTAIVEGLAKQIVNVDVPQALYNKRVLALDLASVVAGTKYRGEFEQRMKKLLEEIQDSDEIILFIDELHSLVGAGSAEGAIDAANILKPALARGEIQCIGATTLDEYRKHIEKDAALERRFQIINVDEPSQKEAINILDGLRPNYETHHHVKYTDEALEAAVRLSHRYLSDSYLPDIAIDVIDEAGSRSKLRSSMPPKEIRELEQELEGLRNDKSKAVASQEFEKAAALRDQERELKAELDEVKSRWKEQDTDTPVIDEEEVAELVSDMSGIPVFKLTEKEQEKLLRLEEDIHKRLINQEEAVGAVSRAIRRARTGLKDPSRPMGSFMFLGPTGVGKTECARALAEILFGDEQHMIRVDMSEFMEKHSVSRLVGAPPGYVGYDEGGQLTEQVRRNPYSVVLLDEIEKAHREVYNILLQIFEDGVLSDNIGHNVDFRNTIIIMTSNVGAREITDAGSMGFRSDEERALEYSEIKDRAMTELKRQFNPEFINRIDEAIVFRSLTREDLEGIVDLMLADVRERLERQQDLELEVSEPARAYLIDKGYDPDYGARPLRRAIERKIEDSLAEAILRGQFGPGSSVSVDYGDEGLTFQEIESSEDDKEEQEEPVGSRESG